MPYSATSAAATSSCVESGLLAQQTTSAPPALSARSRLAVSQVICRHAPSRWPFKGSSLPKRSRIIRSTGICRSAHSIRLRPASASPRSRTSCPLPVELGIRVLLLTKILSLTHFLDLRSRYGSIHAGRSGRFSRLRYDRLGLAAAYSERTLQSAHHISLLPWE